MVVLVGGAGESIRFLGGGLRQAVRRGALHAHIRSLYHLLGIFPTDGTLIRRKQAWLMLASRRSSWSIGSALLDHRRELLGVLIINLETVRRARLTHQVQLRMIAIVSTSTFILLLSWDLLLRLRLMVVLLRHLNLLLMMLISNTVIIDLCRCLCTRCCCRRIRRRILLSFVPRLQHRLGHWMWRRWCCDFERWYIYSIWARCCSFGSTFVVIIVTARRVLQFWVWISVGSYRLRSFPTSYRCSSAQLASRLVLCLAYCCCIKQTWNLLICLCATCAIGISTAIKFNWTDLFVQSLHLFCLWVCSRSRWAWVRIRRFDTSWVLSIHLIRWECFDLPAWIQQLFVAVRLTRTLRQMVLLVTLFKTAPRL